MLLVRLQRLPEDFLSVHVFKVWFISILFERLSSLAILHNVDIVCLLSLCKESTAFNSDYLLELGGKVLQLPVLKKFERRDLPQVLLHFQHLALLSFELELGVV